MWKQTITIVILWNRKPHYRFKGKYRAVGLLFNFFRDHITLTFILTTLHMHFHAFWNGFKRVSMQPSIILKLGCLIFQTSGWARWAKWQLLGLHVVTLLKMDQRTTLRQQWGLRNPVPLMTFYFPRVRKLVAQQWKPGRNQNASNNSWNVIKQQKAFNEFWLTKACILGIHRCALKAGAHSVMVLTHSKREGCHHFLQYST